MDLGAFGGRRKLKVFIEPTFIIVYALYSNDFHPGIVLSLEIKAQKYRMPSG